MFKIFERYLLVTYMSKKFGVLQKGSEQNLNEFEIWRMEENQL